MGSILLPQSESSTEAEYQRILKLIDEANPTIQNPLQCTVSDEPILIPSSDHRLEAAEKSNHENFRNSYRTTSTNGKQLLRELSKKLSTIL